MNNRNLADVEGRMDKARANAVLIAAAPELLAALREVIGVDPMRADNIRKVQSIARAAIAAITKAEGREQ